MGTFGTRYPSETLFLRWHEADLRVGFSVGLQDDHGGDKMKKCKDAAAWSVITQSRKTNNAAWARGPEG